jgi:acyl-CoA synthetase (AMP-forming)/AMP-acid ligase II
MAEPSLTTRLQQRANRQPGGTAHTFIDYEVDPAGVVHYSCVRRHYSCTLVPEVYGRRWFHDG